MKNIIRYFIPLCLVAVSCQPHFDMVPPPTPGQTVEKEFADNWYVTLEGTGSKAGYDWDNALPFAEFLKMISNTTTDLSNSGIHIKKGTYVVPKEADQFLNITKDVLCIRGGYDPALTGEDLSGCDPEAFPTVFSGDLNGSGAADEGDGGFIYVTDGSVRLENITFKYFWKGDGINVDTYGKAGAVIGVNGPYLTTSVECNNCIFEDNSAGFSGSTAYQGGPCAFVSEGYFKARGCVFQDNLGNSRGGAIRTAGKSGVVFLDRCFFTRNVLNDTWGKAIQISDGVLCANNCTLVGHSGKGSSLNGGGAFFLSNNTIMDESSVDGVNNAAFRCESKADRNSIMLNNVFGNVNADGAGIILNSSGGVIVSRGYNFIKSVILGNNCVDPAVAEDVKKDVVLTGTVEDNCWKWELSQIAADIKGYIGADDIYDAAISFDPSLYCGISVLGRSYANWVTPNAFGMDGRGEARGEDFQPGSYDPNLDE